MKTALMRKTRCPLYRLVAVCTTPFHDYDVILLIFFFFFVIDKCVSRQPTQIELYQTPWRDVQLPSHRQSNCLQLTLSPPDLRRFFRQ